MSTLFFHRYYVFRLDNRTFSPVGCISECRHLALDRKIYDFLKVKKTVTTVTLSAFGLFLQDLAISAKYTENPHNFSIKPLKGQAGKSISKQSGGDE